MSEQFSFNEAFNSQTVRGRANVSILRQGTYTPPTNRLVFQVAKATWASVGLVYVLVKMHRRNTKRREAKLYCKGCQQAILG
ncbi:hypothetical protein KR074_005085 [Drosophila pseudoananassae]|nr:hypothetical protein KR074_005085 [Drosophila pseudoananassae]